MKNLNVYTTGSTPVHFVKFILLNTADRAFTHSVLKIDVNKVNKNTHIHRVREKHTHIHIQYMVIDLVVLSGL